MEARVGAGTWGRSRGPRWGQGISRGQGSWVRTMALDKGQGKWAGAWVGMGQGLWGGAKDMGCGIFLFLNFFIFFLNLN